MTVSAHQGIIRDEKGKAFMDFRTQAKAVDFMKRLRYKFVGIMYFEAIYQK